jgi:hypothetical protein
MHSLATPGADHFRQTVKIDRLDAESALDLAAHLLRPGFGAKEAETQPAGPRVESLALEFVCQIEHVRRGDHDDVRMEIGDQLNLLLGLAAGHRDHRAAQPLGAVVGAETTGKQAVTIADVDHVATPATAGVERTRHQLRPHVDVVLGVTDDGRLAGGARGRVHPHHLLARDGEHREGVTLAQIVLGREGKFFQVVEGLQIVGMHPVRLELVPVMRDMLVSVSQGPAQALNLQRSDLVATGGLDRFVGGDAALCNHLADLPARQKP